MNFSDVLTEVLRISGRPDKVVDATRAINLAISFCTFKGEFKKDTVEASLPVNSTLYGATVSIASFTRFRRFKYIKPTAERFFLKELESDKIFTPKNVIQRDVYYVAGTSLTYTLGKLTPTLEVGYYTYAPTLDAITTNTYWMLDMMPFAVIDLAVARIFQTIGDDASATRYQNSGMVFFDSVKNDLSMSM